MFQKFGGAEHLNLVFGVRVDSQRNFVLVEIIDRVEVLEEQSADEVHGTFVILVQVSLVDYEEASVLPCWLQILFCVQLEDVVTELESNWLNFLDDAIA